MVKLVDKVEAEFENIEQVLDEIPDYKKLPYLSILELAGVATLLHNFYNGIENIFKQILKFEQITIPSSSSWHKDLLNLSTKHNIISKETYQVLVEYLAFRHFFSHSYALDLYPTKMEPLVEKLPNTYHVLKTEINQKLDNLNK